MKNNNLENLIISSIICRKISKNAMKSLKNIGKNLKFNFLYVNIFYNKQKTFLKFNLFKN